MSKRAGENELSDLHLMLATVLKEQLHIKDENGRVNSATLNVIRQFLKDNGIDGDKGQVQELAVLAEEFPFEESDVVVPLRQQRG